MEVQQFSSSEIQQFSNLRNSSFSILAIRSPQPSYTPFLRGIGVLTIQLFGIQSCIQYYDLVYNNDN